MWWLISGFFIFVLIWPLVLLMVLPIGVERESDPLPGNSAGAPKATNLKKKMAISAGISLLFTLLIVLVLYSGILINYLED